MVVGDIAGLGVGEGRLSLIMNEAGGIVDDTVITMYQDHVYMVVNGACKDKDMAHFKNYFGASFGDLHMDFDADRQLLALQGKGAKTVLQRLAPSLKVDSMKFMTGVPSVTVAGY